MSSRKKSRGKKNPGQPPKDRAQTPPVHSEQEPTVIPPPPATLSSIPALTLTSTKPEPHGFKNIVITAVLPAVLGAIFGAIFGVVVAIPLKNWYDHHFGPRDELKSFAPEVRNRLSKPSSVAPPAQPSKDHSLNSISPSTSTAKQNHTQNCSSSVLETPPKGGQASALAQMTAAPPIASQFEVEVTVQNTGTHTARKPRVSISAPDQNVELQYSFSRTDPPGWEYLLNIDDKPVPGHQDAHIVTMNEIPPRHSVILVFKARSSGYFPTLRVAVKATADDYTDGLHPTSQVLPMLPRSGPILASMPPVILGRDSSALQRAYTGPLVSNNNLGVVDLTYTITPELSGYAFSPTSQSLSIADAEKQVSGFTLRGWVLESSSSLAGVTIALTGSGHEATTSADGTVTLSPVSYNAIGSLRLVADALGSTRYRYESPSNGADASNPSLGTIEYTYDSHNRLIRRSDASGSLTFEYDLVGNVILSKGRQRRIETYGYYRNSDLRIETSDALDGIRVFNYDSKPSLGKTHITGLLNIQEVGGTLFDSEADTNGDGIVNSVEFRLVPLPNIVQRDSPIEFIRYSGASQDLSSYPLLKKTGTGAGVVTSRVSDIDCGAFCPGVLPSGAAVTLSAEPFSGGNFNGWSDDYASEPSSAGLGGNNCAVATLGEIGILVADFSGDGVQDYAEYLNTQANGSYVGQSQLALSQPVLDFRPHLADPGLVSDRLDYSPPSNTPPPVSVTVLNDGGSQLRVTSTVNNSVRRQSSKPPAHESAGCGAIGVVPRVRVLDDGGAKLKVTTRVH